MRVVVIAAVVAVLTGSLSATAANPQATELQSYVVLASWTRDASPVAAALSEGIDDWLSFGDGPFLRQVLRRCPMLRALPTSGLSSPAAIRAAHTRLAHAYARLRSACRGAEQQAKSAEASLLRLFRTRGDDFEPEWRTAIGSQRTQLGKFEEQTLEPFLRALVRWRSAVIGYSVSVNFTFPRWLGDVGRR